MKKWIILLLALCLLLSCAGLCEGTETTGTAETAEEAEVPTLHQLRYHFEHKLMPAWLYQDKEQFLDYLAEHGCYEIWTNFLLQNNLELVYTGDDFSEEVLPQEDENLMVIRVFLPKPEETPLCGRVYLCLDKATGDAAYFTVEYGFFFSESWFLCGWLEDGNHQNYGGAAALPAPEDPEYAEILAAEAEQVIQLWKSGAEPAAETETGDR